MSEYLKRENVLALAVPIPGCFSNMISSWDVVHMPAADVVEVVRCQECKYGESIGTKTTLHSPYKLYKPECVVCSCEDVVGDEPMVYLPKHFCSYGERRDNNAAD